MSNYNSAAIEEFKGGVGITTLQCICFFCCQGKLDEREETDEYK